MDMRVLLPFKGAPQEDYHLSTFILLFKSRGVLGVCRNEGLQA